VLGKQTQAVVTFAENHDLRDPGRPIVNDKLLAYSYILTHEGYPCVFWHDYFNYNLALADTPNGIAALVQAHEKYAAGETHTLYLDDNLYIMQRTRYGSQPGLISVLNNRGDSGTARGWAIMASATLQPVAWWGHADRLATIRPGHGHRWRPVLCRSARPAGLTLK
jgi:alpha-amylase